MKTLLVTGGFGFIGTNLVAKLLETGGYDIRVLDIAPPDIMKQAFNPLDVQVIMADLRDRAALDRALEGCDGVVHLAAHTQVIKSMENPEENFDVNARGTFGLLQAMRDHGVPYLINASTGGAILGDAQPPVNEDMPARPLSPYGAGKLAAEGYCSAFSGAYGMKTCSLRFSNIYGPWSGRKGSVVPLFIQNILAGRDLVIYGDGEQTRDFLFAGDLVKGIVQALERRAAGVYQLGTGVPVTINRLLMTLEEICGKEKMPKISYQSFRPGEIAHNYCDVSKARAAFGFDPVTSLNEGVTKTFNWFLSREEIDAPKEARTA